MPEAVTYFTARSGVHSRRVLKNAVIFAVAAGLFATLLVVWASGFIGQGRSDLARLVGLAAALIVPTLIVAVLRGLAAGGHRWGTIAVERALSASIRLGLLALLYVIDQLTVTAAVVVTAAVPVVVGLVYVPSVFAVLKESPRSQESPGRKDVLRYGVGLWIGTIAGLLLSRLDQALLAPLSSVSELGLYAIAVTCSEVPLIINTAIREVVFASQSEVPNMDRLGRASRVSTVAVLLGATAVAVLAPTLLPFAFGQEFSGALPVLYWLLVAVVIGNPGSVAGAGLGALGSPTVRSVGMVLALGLNVGMLFLLAPQLGAVGAAIATLVGTATAGVYNTVALKVLHGVPLRTFYDLRLSKLMVAERRICR